MIPTALLRQTIAVEPYKGESAAGPLYTAPVTYAVRIQPKRRQVRDQAGDITISDAVAFLRPDAVVAVGDRVTADETVYRVLAVEVLQGLAHFDHFEVTLGRSET